MKIKLLIIAGATCTGKTNLAIKLAKKFNGEIISADSMQIYKDCNIGTAKCSIDEMQGVKHHLLDFVSPKESFSVGEYKILADQKIEEIVAKNKLPIIVGGTGLYIDAVIKDFNFGDTGKNEELRKYYFDYAKEKGVDALYQILQEKNPVKAEQICKYNLVRVIRAIEIEENQEKSIQNVVNEKYDYFFCVLNEDRQTLYEKINNRVDKMANAGLKDEVKCLLDNGVTFDNQCMKSIGYKEWREFFDDKEDESKIIERIKQNTRRYAKKQITWFRHRDNVRNYQVDDDNLIFVLEKDIKEWLKNER